MNKTLFSYVCILSTILVGGMLSSCNKDDVLGANLPPRIYLENDEGVFDVKIGRVLIISPKYENNEGATYLWLVDGEEYGDGPVFRASWDDPGEYYIDLIVTTSGGRATEEMRVDVTERDIPYISLPFAGSELVLEVGTEYMLTPEIANSTYENPSLNVSWFIDGELFSTGRVFHYLADAIGDFKVKVTAENEDGSDQREFVMKVTDKMPFTLEFPRQSYFMASTTRYTFAGRMVMLRPIIAGLDATEFEWAVNGRKVECDSEIFEFTPEANGEYVVNVTVGGTASASVTVVCVEATEDSRFRKATSISKVKSNRVFEWVPGPGQFIGETQTGGMTGNETTHEAAVNRAESRLDREQYVSLGGFGGYIIVGFDHSIENSETSYDFSVLGNAFFNAATGDGGSNEPGIVYVSQDVNGNGLPDDEWYELRGSETGKTETIANYSVTYYRPSVPGMNVQWIDCFGLTGTIDYLAAFHRQPYYYPLWIQADSYTLYGTRLKDRTVQNSATGMWDNYCFAWGYSDNMGSDVLSSNDAGGGEGQRNGFLIKNAMYINGSPINLKYIDFIKVQTGVNSKSGWLGEVSTEVFGFEDLRLKNEKFI